VIFVTVGTEFPFDRLVRAMDAWAAAHPDTEVLAQVGTGRYQPRHLRWVRRLGRAEYAEAVAGADLIVAHAGVGSLVTACEHGKPLVLMPRRARLGEQRNDHQLDTAAWLRDRPGVHVAEVEGELPARIHSALRAVNGTRAMPATAPDEFLGRLRAFVLG
jgi:UDP-N-acetylglucosamine transferase subunit ALG13